jgi:hypothetical protein
MLFTNKRRPDIMVKTPGLKITEISTVIGKEWKELTNEEKEVPTLILIYRFGKRSPKRKDSCTS